MPGVCRYFMQGNCRYGSDCRFEHPGGPNTGYAYSAQRQLFGGGGRGRGGGRGDGGGRYQQNQNQYKWQASDYNQRSSNTNQQMSPNEVIDSLKNDMNDWENNKMWPFSCVGFEKESPCIPDFEDHSPEELRSAAYEAQKSGNIQAYIQHERRLFEEYSQKRQQLKNITMTLKQKLISLIDDYKLKKKRSSTQASNTTLFSNAAPPPFASSNLSQVGATGSSFGNQGQFGASSTSSAFGASNHQTSFGASNSSQSVFGGSSNNQSAFGASHSTSSVFGGASNNSQSVFGASNATPNSFGSSNSTQSSYGSQPAIGTSSFRTGSQTGSSPLAFGASQNQTVSAFGGPSTTQTGFISATPTPSAFGTSNQQQSTGLFGKPANDTSQTQTTGLFGKPATSPASNLFGGFASNNSFAPTGASPSVFPSGNASSGFSSGTGHSGGFQSGATAGAASGGSDKKYTPLDQLSPEELEAFQATKFTIGKIPTKPPPKELV